MRVPVLLSLLTAVSMAHAEEVPPATVTPLSCKEDSACGAEEKCVEGRCTARPSLRGTIGAFIDRWSMAIGFGFSSEIFPVSSVSLPGSSTGQLSLYGGPRFWLGWHWPKRVRLMGVFDFGYATAGRAPGHGAQGVMEGAGAEVDLEYFERVKPFVRFTYDALVFPISATGDGTLAFSAWYFSAGVRLYFVDLHLSLGRDFAGGVSPGFGLGAHWIY